ncbi:MAG: hypothetical protein AB8H80_11085 [Planctomycetota bacterium]
MPQRLPEVVLADSVDPVRVREFGLGDGGVRSVIGRRGAMLQFDRKDGCITPGGVRVICRPVGVVLIFPSGRELLLGPDGTLHLRSGERAGPFPSGLEFRLADESRVRVLLAQSRKSRVRDVWVVHGDRCLQPWRRGKAVKRDGSRRERPWAGRSVACLGDGGDIYRAVALGPLIALERLLVAEEREGDTPRERLVLLSKPLRHSLQTMQRGHREANAAVRRAVTAVAAVADRGATIFPAGAKLARAEKEAARWLLRGGFEVALTFEGPLAPRLQLFAGERPVPMVEWTLGAACAAYLSNPRDDQPSKRWHGNGTRLQRVATDLQVREHLKELPYVLNLLRRFERRGK